MALEGLLHIKKALTNLNSSHVRALSERQVRVGLHAHGQEAYQRIENFFLRDLSPARRRQSAILLARAPFLPGSQPADIQVFDEGVVSPQGAPVFRPDHPQLLVTRTLTTYPDLGVPLAKSFLPFRKAFVERTIAKVARENMLFSLTTALPDVIPNLIELPWAVAEFASDTAFLTMNQVRMAFLIAAASDREVGYMEQKSEIAMVIGSAFGWRAIARQLIGKIPFGGGLIAKAAVAYAGTKVLGLSLDHYYSIGFTYTREERDRLYSDAFRQGKQAALRILKNFRPDLAAKLAAEASRTTPRQPAALPGTSCY
ncbi:MAG TPA: hypothetical protein VH302_08315 [Bryobacteraceae bacterium]|nr:hypothetical protein [Bryobacteraceae bacterium]